MVESEPGVPGLRPAAADIFHVTRIHCSGPKFSNLWDNNDNRTYNRVAPHKKMTNMSKLTCDRSIKPFLNPF